jgi:hypothetical protein
MKIFSNPMTRVRKSRYVFLPMAAMGIAFLIVSFNKNNEHHFKNGAVCCNNPRVNHVCIMKTIFGLDTAKDQNALTFSVSSPLVDLSIKKGLEWMSSAQAKDGGWGAGTHNRQEVLDPHAVQSDPATTAIVAMSFLRTDNTLEKGNYSTNLKKATDFLIETVEACPDNQPYLTNLINTQPQIKLGRNIDVILTAQFFTNIIRYNISDPSLKRRIEKALDKCIHRIEKGQDTDGSWKDGGWAPVLQSALANNALESAKDVGRKVDSNILNRGYTSLNENFDEKTKSAITGKSAGVMLYGLSSTTRGSAKDAREAQEVVVTALQAGKIQDKEVNEENLRKAGVSAAKAKKLATAYSINRSSREQAMRDDVMSGFGSNGGEEFLSYLMTGESLLMQGGNDWRKWYDMMESKLVKIQNEDGSWNGHHCITSPVFCTATCLLILSIHNDMQFSIEKLK